MVSIIKTPAYMYFIMAESITKKKLTQLSNKLKEKKVEMEVTKKAVDAVKEKGISKEYAALEVIIKIVFLKFTLRPLESVIARSKWISALP